MTLKSTRDMMEKVNISQALNNLSVKDDADFFYGETSSKPVKIKKSNLFTSVFAYKGLLSSDKDLNTISENGIYYSAFAMNSPENISGLLLHYAEKDMASQILINSRNGELYTRSRDIIREIGINDSLEKNIFYHLNIDFITLFYISYPLTLKSTRDI